jgi:hypothetical protein
LLKRRFGLKQIRIFILIFTLLSGTLFAQVAEEEEYQIPRRIDLAIAEAFAINIGLWSLNRYVREENYSFFISWRSVENNLRHGFEWDPNPFQGNFLDHPYHGSTYFNAARTNGLNFWESAPFSFGGSVMWEVFMESEYPSYNDLVATTYGGIALGELLYRFSEQVLDDRARGWNRFWREFAGFVLNPVGGFNRLIRGDFGRRSSSVDHTRNPLRGYLAMGIAGRLSGSSVEDVDFKSGFKLDMLYGKPFEEKSSRKPFDYFNFRLWSSPGEEQRNLTILARGVLAGKNFDSKKGQKHLIALFQHYDYVNTELFKIGAMVLGGSSISRFPLGDEFSLVVSPHVGAILLGAGNNEYVNSYQDRDYNYGWGFKGKIDALLRHRTFGSLMLDYSYFSIYAREGAPGVDRLSLFITSYNVPIWKNFGGGLEYLYYYRSALYDEFPDVSEKISTLEALISYSF